ncbi:short-chain dehydrogenase/reductase 2 [Drechmeria coniospora]|uniref:Short-chain dehydrogenase/reductase 3 n=1 Tax=Drechmeria coniospora TaxID=98403 RepID=A0A151GUX4_DRECN|nr:short-chain dehydrogenase/reductase 2 [Drechmeria coniospora]KYK60853.1 short-chain dehydrogenase/reductase 2 [Drechmeria coniospora]ODA83548.1 hypothetical protein RJ55_02062 [Drechmeria coniospora]
MSMLLNAMDSPAAWAIHKLAGAVLSPVFSGSLLLALVVAPEPVRLELLSRLPVSELGPVVKALKVLLALAVVRSLNAGLSTMAANSWRATKAKGWHWPDEVAVVTGGCSGIGYGIVERLARRGVKVAILDIQDLPEAFEKEAGIRYYRCDITSAAAVSEAAAAVRAELGDASILVNNAGIANPMSILDVSQDFLRKIFAVNCLSHWTLVQEFLPAMIKRNKGHVVTVASIASFVSMARGADYSATKAAALSFHESLAAELEHFYHADGVLTSVVHPNFVRTPLVNAYADGLEESGVRLLTPEYVSAVIAGQIFGRRGGQLVLPEHASGIAALRGWPTWLQVIFRNAVANRASKLVVP